MGIRFYCPNGHKLNVKTYLAGKRGICPHCGAKVLIPEKSVRPSSKEKRDEAGASPGTTSADTESKKTGVSENTSPAQEGERYDSVVEESGPPKSESAEETAPVDPIAENPNAIWYVRPPGGHQYGPATGTVLKTWLDEGRIGRDTLVWREGWPSWLEAANVFPQLAKLQPIDKPPKPGELPREKQPTAKAPAAEAEQSQEPRPQTKLADQKRAKSRRNLILVIILLLFTLIMMLVLVYVLQRPPAGEQDEEARLLPPASSVLACRSTVPEGSLIESGDP